MDKKQLTPMEIMEGVIALEAEGFPIEKLSAYISDDCVVHEAPSLPVVGGDWTGVQGFIDLMAAVRATFPNFLFELEKIITDDASHAAVKAWISGDTPGGRFRTRLLEFWTFRDGKVVDVVPSWQDIKHVIDLYNAQAAVAATQ